MTGALKIQSLSKRRTGRRIQGTTGLPVLRKGMEQGILSAITKHMQGIRPSQSEFVKGRSCLVTLMSSYGKMTGLVDEGQAVDTVCLDFSEAFDTASCSSSWRT